MSECEAILNEYRSEEAIQVETVMVQTLEQLQSDVRTLEDIVADLIEDEDELEKNEGDAYTFVITTKKMATK